jgi:hypothetical protein
MSMSASCAGDETALFAELHPKLARQVGRLVRTSEENVQDACSFAFLQLLRYEPSRESAFSWLLTVAVREAVKLGQRGRREPPFPVREDGVEFEPVDERVDPEIVLETLAAIAGRWPIRPAGSDRGAAFRRLHVRVDQQAAGAEPTDGGAAAAARPREAAGRARRARGVRNLFP